MKELVSGKVGETVLIRTRVHNRRSAGEGGEGGDRKGRYVFTTDDGEGGRVILKITGCTHQDVEIYKSLRLEIHISQFHHLCNLESEVL